MSSFDPVKTFNFKSDRVKSVDFHSTDPWLLCALYSGNVHIYNYKTESLVKQCEICNLPVRCAKFIPKKPYFLAASDDMKIRLYNLNSLEKIREFEAHADYIRYLTVSPLSTSQFLSCSDDLTIKLWDIDGIVSGQNLNPLSTFEGHAHYVMQVAWNPREQNQFASASLDRAVKVWNTATAPNCSFTLNGHTKGVNCVDYMSTGDKPYILSGGDDKTIRIWDYQTKQCLQVISNHEQNVSAVLYHSKLPLILSTSEDGSFMIHNANTYRLESTKQYGMERGWCLSAHKSLIALGCDEGSLVLSFGSDSPLATFSNGRIIATRGHEILGLNLKVLVSDEGVTNLVDGERVLLNAKEIGNSDVFPLKIYHQPAGRLFTIVGDGEYVIYISSTCRNKSFGRGIDFAWSPTQKYAVLSNSGTICFFDDFKESHSISLNFKVNLLVGGPLLAVVSEDFICFYKWTDYSLVQKIDIMNCSNIWWSESFEYFVISSGSDNSFYYLKYDSIDPEEPFELLNEFLNEEIDSAIFVKNFFFFCHNSKICTLVGGKISVVSNLLSTRQSSSSSSTSLTLLGYMEKLNKLILFDGDYHVIPVTLNVGLIEYQTAICDGDYLLADELLKNGSVDQKDYQNLAEFLKGRGEFEMALGLAQTNDLKYDLLIELNRFEEALELSPKISNRTARVQRIGDGALKAGNFPIAVNAYEISEDFHSLFLIYVAGNSSAGVQKVVDKINNIKQLTDELIDLKLMCLVFLRKPVAVYDELKKLGRLYEAAVFARTYLPSKLLDDAELVSFWKSELSRKNPELGKSIAFPSTHPELYSNWSSLIQKEQTSYESTTSNMKPKIDVKKDISPPPQIAQEDLIDTTENVIEEDIIPSYTPVENSGDIVTSSVQEPIIANDSIEDSIYKEKSIDIVEDIVDNEEPIVGDMDDESTPSPLDVFGTDSVESETIESDENIGDNMRQNVHLDDASFFSGDDEDDDLVFA